MAALSLLLNMLIVSISTPLSIAAADICLNPKDAYLQYVKDDPVVKSVVVYYIECFPEDNQLISGFNQTFMELNTLAQLIGDLEMEPEFNKLSEVKDIKRNVDNSILEMKNLIEISSCRNVHYNYGRFVEAVCSTILNGFGLVIVSSLTMVVCLIATMLCIIPLWKAIAPLKPILKKYGVHIVTGSYQGPPGFVTGSESFHGSSSFDASYKSIDDPEDFEHLPLVNKKKHVHSYRATVHGSTEFLSVEEERREKSCL